ncbi:MAG: hypothetical protein HKN47_11175 [Pirellulaceae bacterium]|nr:hypothetical protein [Pirellulaceae bacterium]
MSMLDEGQIARQRDALAEIADQRLEEGAGQRLNNLSFASQAVWINRREIGEAILAARPWEFPKRLSRLTLASVSTVAILLMTAESWDLALSQPQGRVATLAVFSLVVTTTYVILRQQLLVRRTRARSEQRIVTSISGIGIVFVGMTVTWLALLLLAFVVSSLLFDGPLIASWAASMDLEGSDISAWDHLQMAWFCGSVGLLIGALGASFESQNYFRHIIFVDEEI